MGKWNVQRRQSHRDLPRLHELECAVQAELKDVQGRGELFLRSTSELALLMKTFGRTQGRAYFRYVLRDVFGETSKLYDAREPPSTGLVCAYAKSIIQRLVKAIHFAPLVLRAGCHYMLTEFRKAFPECKQDVRIVVGSLLFLRILCPALIKPEMFDFPAHTAQSLPMGVQIAKLLQHTLSGTPMGDCSDSAVTDSNAFIYAFQPSVASFLVRFPQIRAVFSSEEYQQVAEVQGPAPSTPTREHNRPSSPTTESWDAYRPSGDKMCGFSMSINSASKHKKKFSLRFWSRGQDGSGSGSDVAQQPTP